MKRILLAASFLTVSGAAHAQWSVIDIPNLVNTGRQVVQGAQQIEQLVTQVQVLRQQYEAIAHLPDQALREMQGVFAVPSLRSPVPGQGADLSRIVGGLGAALGSNGRSTQLNMNAASIAGTQGLSQQLYQSATDHAAALWQMEAQLGNSPDAKTTADIQARLQMEQAQLQARTVQASAISTAQAAQVRMTTQQYEETRRCYIEAVLAGKGDGPDTCARSAAGGVIDASAGTAGGTTLAQGYEQFLGQSVGTGQCVALVEAADPAIGRTSNWAQGAAVQGNAALQPGTPIATFDGAGRYANATDGSSHAAIYLGQNENGIQVEDQWLGHAASTRTIKWLGNNQANSGSAFYVIGAKG